MDLHVSPPRGGSFITSQTTTGNHKGCVVMGVGCPPSKLLHWSELGASCQGRTHTLLGAHRGHLGNSFIQTPSTRPLCVHPNGQHNSSVLHKLPGRQKVVHTHARPLGTVPNSGDVHLDYIRPRSTQQSGGLSEQGRYSPSWMGAQLDVLGPGLQIWGVPETDAFASRENLKYIVLRQRRDRPRIHGG